MDTYGAQPNIAQGMQAPGKLTEEENKGLPFSPTGEVTLSQAAWKKLDQQGYQVDVTRREDRGTAETEPKDIVAAMEQPKGLYDYLRKKPPRPRGTLLEENIYQGSGDYLRMGAHPNQDKLEGKQGPSLPRHEHQDDHCRPPPSLAEEKRFRLTGPLLDSARMRSCTDGCREGRLWISSRPSVTQPVTQEAGVGFRQSGMDGHRPNLKPQQYDGSKPLREYLHHFKVVASLNRWSDTEKALYLAASLTGPAQRILNRVNVYAPGGYDQLLLALQERYAPCHQEELYRASLKNRRQGKEESLRTLVQEVEIAVEKAYRYADRATVEQLTTEHFLTAVWDRRVRQWVHLRGPRNLRDAVALALQAEAYYKGEDVRMPQKTQMMTTGYGAQEYGHEDYGFSADIEQIAAVSSHRRMPQTAESREMSQGMTEGRVMQLVREPPA